MEENKENKIKLEGLVIYSNQNCPYCKTIKTEFEKQEIEFENRDTTEFRDEWNDVSKLTGIPSVPTVKYKEEYFVPGRDFHNPQSLIQILSGFKTSDFDTQKRVLEKLTTLNFHFSQAMNHLGQQIRTIDTKLTELQIKPIEKPEQNKEDNVDKSTD